MNNKEVFMEKVLAFFIPSFFIPSLFISRLSGGLLISLP
ncbi:putative membrane protein [Helicobacter pylori NQ4161]|nr:putative membrane protein [Helicobacter pylori NQ4161]